MFEKVRYLGNEACGKKIRDERCTGTANFIVIQPPSEATNLGAMLNPTPTTLTVVAIRSADRPRGTTELMRVLQLYAVAAGLLAADKPVIVVFEDIKDDDEMNHMVDCLSVMTDGSQQRVVRSVTDGVASLRTMCGG